MPLPHFTRAVERAELLSSKPQHFLVSGHAKPLIFCLLAFCGEKTELSLLVAVFLHHVLFVYSYHINVIASFSK